MRKKLRALIIRVQRSTRYRRLFRSFLLRNIVFDMTGAGEGHYFSVYKNNRVIGGLYLSYVHDEYREGWLITALRVNRLYRHLGIGKQLLTRVADFASGNTPRKIYAYVLTEYPDIIDFYESSGFSIEPELSRQDQSIDLTPMSKTIPSAAPGQSFF